MNQSVLYNMQAYVICFMINSQLFILSNSLKDFIIIAASFGKLKFFCLRS